MRSIRDFKGGRLVDIENGLERKIMSAAEKVVSNQISQNTTSSTASQDSPIDSFKRRNSKELVVAFAGPVGCGISTIIDQTKLSLESYGYAVRVIKLSEFIRQEIAQGSVSVSASYNSDMNPEDRYFLLQDGGNALREKYGSDILAEFAIRKIVTLRAEMMPEQFIEEPKNYVPEKVAYLIDQVKHPAEVKLLRTVYRNLFQLIGVVSTMQNRESRLKSVDKIKPDKISQLTERDRKEEEDNGQQLDKALQLADFFVRSDKKSVDAIKRQMYRFASLLHGENSESPTPQEYGMYIAYAAGLKSACLSRQVGAAITNSSGEILSSGCNDVPSAGGGLYRSGFGDNDRRCIHREEQVCFNDREKNELKKKMLSALKNLRSSDSGELLVSEENLQQILDSVYSASKIKDLIEFSRAVHAEMDAIISLARMGVPGVQGGVLYTTTFPCHSCARHIVTAGISKVYYIEPYEKSLAQSLHDDAIEFDTEDGVDNPTEAGKISKVKFIHFEGVAPRQYLNFFARATRKDSGGKVINIAQVDAGKSTVEYLDDYRDFESKVVVHLTEINREKAGLSVAK